MISLAQGIVLRKIKYGDSSQIAHIFTKQFGLQSCMAKGLSKRHKASEKSNLLYPASIVALELYYNESKNIKLIKEIRPEYFFQQIGENIPKNGVAVFAMEVLRNLLLADHVQEELFEFCYNFLIYLDQSKNEEIANYPLYFLVQSCKILGYHILGKYSTETPYLDIQDGRFIAFDKSNSDAILKTLARYMSEINIAQGLDDIAQIKMSRSIRKAVLEQFQQFFEIHLPYFKPLKSVAVLSEILS